VRLGLSFGIGPIRAYIPLNKRRRRPATTTKYWTHGACPVHHQRHETAEACAKRMKGK
jgi:hypothetical protein